LALLIPLLAAIVGHAYVWRSQYALVYHIGLATDNKVIIIVTTHNNNVTLATITSLLAVITGNGHHCQPLALQIRHIVIYNTSQHYVTAALATPLLAGWHWSLVIVTRYGHNGWPITLHGRSYALPHTLVITRWSLMALVGHYRHWHWPIIRPLLLSWLGHITPYYAGHWR